MQKVYLYLLNKLDNNKDNKISIPELGIDTVVGDKITTALLLSPLFKYSRPLDIDFKEKVFNKERVLKVVEMLEMMESLKINYIGLVGGNTEEAFKYAKSKWGDKFITNEMFDLIMTKNQIYIPIHSRVYDEEDLMALSTLGVTVMSLSLETSTVYINGQETLYNPFNSIPFINFINNIGYFIDEYLLGDLLYYISTIDDNIKDIIIENIDSVFVRSLSSMFSSPHFNQRARSYRLDDGSEFSDLIGILKSFNFERIKDFQYTFVRSFLYDKV